MRRSWLLLSALCCLVPALAAAQSLGLTTAAPAEGSAQVPFFPGPNSITQSLDPSTITPGNSVACTTAGLHTDNSYIRRFLLEVDHGIVNQFDVTSVDFGIEVSTPAGADQPVDINLYTIPIGTPLTFANLSLIGSGSIAVAAVAQTVITVAVSGTVPDPTTQDLVVEIFTPDGRPAGNSFFVGSNPNGQTGPSFLAAADCGFAEPTDLVTIGFPDMHIVMVVNGTEECTAIPDDGYDGTLGSMACLTIAGDPVIIGGLDVVLGIDHTWVGDLTIKLVSPSMEVLTLMSRPGFAESADDGSGCCGDSSNISSAFPVTFDDASLNDAELMGSTILGGEIVCEIDGICDYFPNPGAGPGTDLAQFIGQDATGDWMLCVGDSADGDLGELCDAQLDFSDIFADGFESGNFSAWSVRVP